VDAAADYWTLMMYRSENTSHGGDKTPLLDTASQNSFMKLFLAFQSAVSKQLSLAAEGVIAARQGRMDFARAAAGGVVSAAIFVGVVRVLIKMAQGGYEEREDPNQDPATWLALNIGKQIPQEVFGVIPFLGPGIKAGIAELMGETAYNGPIDILTSGIESAIRATRLSVRAGSELINPTLNADLETERTKYVVDALRAWANPLSLGTGIPIQGTVKLFDTASSLTGIGRDKKTIEALKRDANRTESVTQEARGLMVAIITDDEPEFQKRLEQYQSKRPDASFSDIRAMITRFYGSDSALQKLVEDTEGAIPQDEIAKRKAARDAAYVVAEDLWQRNNVE
jgi:hypothetical protein